MARTADTTYRISSFQEILLKSTALVLDGIGFLLTLTVIGEIATEIIGLTGDVLFLTWFWMLGTKFFEGRASSKVMTFIVNAVAEAVPFVNGVYPGFSIGVWRLVKITKEEDEEKARKNKAAQGAIDARRVQELRRAEAIQAARAARAANDDQELAEAA